MKAVLPILVLGLLGGFAGFGQYRRVRNDLVAQRQAIGAAWAQVDAALQQRADLIPGREKPVLDGLATARAALVRARSPQQKIEANSRPKHIALTVLGNLENFRIGREDLVC